jgi:tetratricopeptide (TPR) repeat protein
MPCFYPWMVVWWLAGAPLLAKEAPPPTRLAVLEFAAEEELAWLGAGFAATLAARLDLLSSLQTQDFLETQALARRLQVAAGDNASVQSLGHQLGVDYVATGRLSREGDQLAVEAWLISTRTGRRQGEERLTGKPDSLFAMQHQFLTAWLRIWRLRPSREEATRLEKYLPTESLRAFEFFGRGLVCYDPDRPQEALGIWEQAVEFDPRFALAREVHGRAAYRYQELLYEQALQQYRQALALAPDNARLHYLLGMAYGGRGKFQEALQELREALRLKPTYVDAHYQIGLILLSELNRPNEAIPAFNALLAIDPAHVKARNNLGVALWQIGRRSEALSAWQEALRYDPDNPFVRENLERFGK